MHIFSAGAVTQITRRAWAGEIVKLATDLGGGAAETEKVGELQRDDPKTNRRASRTLRLPRKSAFSRSPPVLSAELEGLQMVEAV